MTLAMAAFGHAPKFPHPAALDLLIDHATRHRDERAKELYLHTLERMARGGMYDQLCGGFHRYSTDERWVVPHFEKNGVRQLGAAEELRTRVSSGPSNPFFSDVARDILRWMDEWLSDRERGGFYASQDADDSMEVTADYLPGLATQA